MIAVRTDVTQDGAGDRRFDRGFCARRGGRSGCSGGVGSAGFAQVDLVVLAVDLDVAVSDGDVVVLAVDGDDVVLRTAGLGRSGGGTGSSLRRFERNRAVGAGGEELERDLREHGIGQHVVDIDARDAQLFLEFGFDLRQFVRDRVGRTLGDRLVHVEALERLLDELGIGGGRGLAVVADQQVHRFGGQVLVTAHQNVQDGLRADDLRGRGDEGGVAEVLADAGVFLEHFVQLVEGVLLTQLAFQVGEHAAGDLRVEDAGIGADEGAFELGVLRTHDVTEVGRDVEQQVHVEAGVELGALEDFNHRFGRRVAGAHRHRRDRGVDDLGAGFGGLDQRRDRHAGGGVRVDVDRQVGDLLDRLDQVVGDVGAEQRGHVLDAQAVGAHFGEFLGQLDVALDGVHRRDGVADRGLGVLAGLLDGLQRHQEVTRVVQCVEDTEDVDAVDGHALDALLDDVVGVVAIAEDGLAAQQHLVRGVRHRLLELAHALPRILVQEADAGVERGAAPGFERPEAGLVELLGDREHVGGDHAGGVERLVGVAQDVFTDSDFSHGYCFPLKI